VALCVALLDTSGEHSRSTPGWPNIRRDTKVKTLLILNETFKADEEKRISLEKKLNSRKRPFYPVPILRPISTCEEPFQNAFAGYLLS
jgi:hypothetical protein